MAEYYIPMENHANNQDMIEKTSDDFVAVDIGALSSEAEHMENTATEGFREEEKEVTFVHVAQPGGPSEVFRVTTPRVGGAKSKRWSRRRSTWLGPRKVLFVFAAFYNLRCKAKTVCTGSTYAPGSRFQTNLLQVFSELHSNNPPKLFYNASFGEEPDQVFGMALCRGDNTISNCAYCLKLAIGNITEGCPNSTTAVIWLNTCMLRYSDKTFFTVANTSQGYCRLDSLVTEPNTDDLMTSLSTLLTNLSNAAANNPQLFAVGTENLLVLATLHCDCYRCLVNNRKGLLSIKFNQGKRGARIYQESCYLWYSETRFYISHKFLNITPIKTTNGTATGGGTNSTKTTNGTATGGGTNASTKTTNGTAGQIRSKTIIMTLSGLAGLAIIVTFIICLWKRFTKFSSGEIVQSGAAEVLVRTDDNDIRPDTRNYSIEELKTATENFSSSKRLGEGGYGEVYEGIIDGNLVAVKRLFKASKENEKKLMKDLFGFKY